MSQMTVTILDGNRAIHSQPHGSFADVLVAALSAEPETIEELEAALERFVKPARPGRWPDGTRESATSRTMRGSASWTLPRASLWPSRRIPCPARAARFSTATRSATSKRGSRIMFRTIGGLPARSTDGRAWRNRGGASGGRCPRLDARQVLYGQVCEFVVAGVLCGAGTDVAGRRVGAAGGMVLAGSAGACQAGRARQVLRRGGRDPCPLADDPARGPGGRSPRDVLLDEERPSRPGTSRTGASSGRCWASARRL